VRDEGAVERCLRGDTVDLDRDAGDEEACIADSRVQVVTVEAWGQGHSAQLKGVGNRTQEREMAAAVFVFLTVGSLIVGV
jgi:hypothetical protein